MSNFDNFWNTLQEIYSDKDIKILYNEIKCARKIIFVAKGRVGLVTKMFMQRLIQTGHDCYFFEDLNLPRINEKDLVIFVTASGNTKSSKIYVEIAKACNTKTLSITFNNQGEIPNLTNKKIVFNINYVDNDNKAMYEIAFFYIFEKFIQEVILKNNNFVHTNME